MGYKSDIYIKINKKLIFAVKKELYSKLDALGIKKEQGYTTYTDNNYIYILMQDWKFYKNYPEVQIITNFIDKYENRAALIEVGQDNAVYLIGDTYEVNLTSEVIIHGFSEELIS